VVTTAVPECSIDHLSFDFGVVQVGRSSDRQFAIANMGGGVLSGNVSEDRPEYTIVAGGGSFSLSRGEVRMVTVRFMPSFDGTHSCIVHTGTECAEVVCTGVGADVICFDFDQGFNPGFHFVGASTWSSEGGWHHDVPDNFQERWSDDTNWPNAQGEDPDKSNGSFWMDTIENDSQAIPSPPAGDTWWMMQIKSPDLDSYAGWQEAIGFSTYSLDHISRSGAAACYYSVHFTVWDEDSGTERSWNDVFGTAMTVDSWRSDSILFGGDNFPANWHLRRIFIQIWGKIGYIYDGGLYLDEICPIFSAQDSDLWEHPGVEIPSSGQGLAIPAIGPLKATY